MANTYTQIYLQLVFSPLGRDNLIVKSIKEELQKYTTGIIQKRKHKLLTINYMPDHVHIFIGYQPTQSLPDLLRDIKSNTSHFINEKKWMPGRFQWQEGYGAFSYSRSHIDDVIKYINNQEDHHKRLTFKEEYLNLLQKFEVEYDEKYLFEWI
ncbi:MAG TPA: IS200/IS605 family transposase [Prolixibacteraceae bacterium]|nr:IS200/IS605 family transposase [Prolixibacteraceae bacterium]